MKRIISTAQISINGEILDNATKQPVEGASITILPNNITTISDANGRFRFKDKLLKAVDEDTNAFNQIMLGFGLPKATEEEKAPTE